MHPRARVGDTHPRVDRRCLAHAAEAVQDEDPPRSERRVLAALAAPRERGHFLGHAVTGGAGGSGRAVRHHTRGMGRPERLAPTEAD